MRKPMPMLRTLKRKVWGRVRPRALRMLRGTPKLEIDRFSSIEEYREHSERMKHEIAAQERLELGMIPEGVTDGFWITAYCAVCGSWTRLLVDHRFSDPREAGGRPFPNWRETLSCMGCGLNNRMRASLQLFREYVRPSPQASVYMTEQVTPLFARVLADYPNTVGSEFLGDGTTAGSVNSSGACHEDLTRLTFGDEQFDFLLSFEVLEHVPDYAAALGECARVLKPGGTMVVTVPFHGGPSTTVRARIGPGGVEHILPPEYHGDPVNSEGCLCFYHYGWDFLDAIREAGFREASACFVYSRPLGYLLRGTPFLIARR
jgi:SAM-dependent methyltransferase